MKQGKNNQVLVAMHESTDEKHARAARQKGVGSEGEAQWLVKDVAAEMRTWGHQGGEGGKVILKCDGAKSIVALRGGHYQIPWGEKLDRKDQQEENPSQIGELEKLARQ